MSVVLSAAPAEVYRCWAGAPGRWVPVAGAIPCFFDGFGDWPFFSHVWGEGRYRVTEALTGYGVDGADGFDRTNTYETRGAAIDAAEGMLRQIGFDLFKATVDDVLAARGEVR